METWEVELNEKLARWAGFKRDGAAISGWVNPSGDSAQYGLPDFPNSLDACFKWLVPKLVADSPLDVVLLTSGYGGATTYTAMLCPTGVTDSKAVEKASTPALALCRAIAKIVDSES